MRAALLLVLMIAWTGTAEAAPSNAALEKRCEKGKTEACVERARRTIEALLAACDGGDELACGAFDGPPLSERPEEAVRSQALAARACSLGSLRGCAEAAWLDRQLGDPRGLRLRVAATATGFTVESSAHESPAQLTCAPRCARADGWPWSALETELQRARDAAPFERRASLVLDDSVPMGVVQRLLQTLGAADGFPELVLEGALE